MSIDSLINHFNMVNQF